MPFVAIAYCVAAITIAQVVFVATFTVTALIAASITAARRGWWAARYTTALGLVGVLLLLFPEWWLWA